MDKFDLVRFTDNDFELDVRADSENETVWLTQDEIAFLFERDKSVISRHIRNIFVEGELEKDRVVAKNATTGIKRRQKRMFHLPRIPR